MRIPPSSIAILPVNRGQSNSPTKPEKTLAQGEQKTAPPGLERALARLQSRPEPTAGQSNATDRISRNLARYAATQAIGTPTAPAATNPTAQAQTPTAPTNADATNSGIETTA